MRAEPRAGIDSGGDLLAGGGGVSDRHDDLRLDGLPDEVAGPGRLGSQRN